MSKFSDTDDDSDVDEGKYGITNRIPRSQFAASEEDEGDFNTREYQPEERKHRGIGAYSGSEAIPLGPPRLRRYIGNSIDYAYIFEKRYEKDPRGNRTEDTLSFYARNLLPDIIPGGSHGSLSVDQYRQLLIERDRLAKISKVLYSAYTNKKLKKIEDALDDPIKVMALINLIQSYVPQTKNL